MKQVKTYGRSSKNDVSFLDDEMMSREHCKIIKHNDDLYEIIDLQSTNGTYVNYHRIEPNKPYYIKPTDIVNIGQTTLNWVNDFKNKPSKSFNIKQNIKDKVENNDLGKNIENNNISLLVFFLGLLSAGIVGYIITKYLTSTINYFASGFGGIQGMLKLFPVYLHGVGFGGKWIEIILAIVFGGAADFVDGFYNKNDKENRLASIGIRLANIGLSIAIFFLVLAFLAPYIIKF